MQIAVLSDLHLGKKDRLDRFARNHPDVEVRFLRLLRTLERHVDRIVLLGDIFETLKGSRPGGARRELREALVSYPQIAMRAIDDPRYELVSGNHDAVARSALGAPEFREVSDRGSRLIFFHGHQLDPIARGRGTLSQAGVWIGGWLERMGIRLPLNDQRRRHDAHSDEEDTFARSAVALGRGRGADIVVTGHTHRAIRREIGDQLYLNSGTCVGGRQELLLLDTRAGTYDVLYEPDLGEASI